MQVCVFSVLLLFFYNDLIKAKYITILHEKALSWIWLENSQKKHIYTGVRSSQCTVMKQDLYGSSFNNANIYSYNIFEEIFKPYTMNLVLLVIWQLLKEKQVKYIKQLALQIKAWDICENSVPSFLVSGHSRSCSIHVLVYTNIFQCEWNKHYCLG